MAARQATAIARQSQAHGNRQQAAHRALAIAQVRGDEYNLVTPYPYPYP